MARLDREHEQAARRRARGRDPRRGDQRRLVTELHSKLGGLGVPADLQELVVHAVTHGGLPANAALAMLANPVVAAEALLHPGMLGKILDAATASFGHGLHVGLVVAASILLAGAVVSLVGERATRPLAASTTRAPSGEPPPRAAPPEVPKFRRAKPAALLAERRPRRRARHARARGTPRRDRRRGRARGSRARRGSRPPAACSPPPAGAPRGARRAARGSGRGGGRARRATRPPCSNAAIAASTPKMARVCAEVTEESARQPLVHRVRAGDDHARTSARRGSRSSTPRRRTARSPSPHRRSEVRDVGRSRHRHRSVHLVGDHGHAVRGRRAPPPPRARRARERRPVGLCGWQSRYARAPAANARSRPSRSSAAARLEQRHVDDPPPDLARAP